MTDAPALIRLGDAPRPSWLSDEAVEDAQALEPKPFPPQEFEDRISAVRGQLEDRELDAVAVFRPSSVDYLCGHHTVESVPQPLLVTAENVRLYVPDPEIGRALASATVGEIAHFTASADALDLIAADIAILCRGGRVALEDREPTVPPRMAALLHRNGIEAMPADYLVERARLVLSAAEIQCMERAAAITQRGVDAALDAFADGVTDSQLGARIGQALRAHADSSAAMDVIIATGPRGGVPHSSFQNLPLSNDLTFVEFAGTDRRYHAPVMMTLANRVDDEGRRLEALAQKMLSTLLQEVRPGRSAGEVAEAVTAELDLRERDIFHFNFGYAIGLAHPPSWLDGFPFSIVRGNSSPIEAGMAFHLPASFRSFARRGVGLSHALVVEADGPRVLTGAEPRIRGN